MIEANALPEREAPGSQHRGEVTRNQLWETLNTGARTGFFFLACPYFIRTLGSEAFGQFALAVSVLACMVALDLGLRPLARVALSEAAAAGDAARSATLAEIIAGYVAIFGVALAIAAGLKVSGGWELLFRGASGAGYMMSSAIALSGLFVISSLLVEPIAASGRLSQVKMASCAGNAASIPAVMALIYLRADVSTIAAAFFLCLTLPFLALALFSRYRLPFWQLVASLRFVQFGKITAILFQGRWFGVLTAEWLAKSYALTFLIGSMIGPAEAGTFFILLKLSELLSVLGASAWETVPAAMSATREREVRFEAFRYTYRYTQAMSLPGFVLLACFCPWIMDTWFHRPLGVGEVGVWVGCYGIAGVWRAANVATAMGTGHTGMAACWGLLEAIITVGGTLLLAHVFQGAAVFLAGALGGLAFVASAWHLARKEFHRPFWSVWVLDALPFWVGIVMVSVAAIVAHRAGNLAVLFGTALVGGIACLLCWKGVLAPRR